MLEREVYLRLRWYLKLCEEYLDLTKPLEKKDHYISRYIVIGISVLVSRNLDILSFVSNMCGQEVVEKLIDLGSRFLQAMYSYEKNNSVLNLLRILCTCLSRLEESRATPSSCSV